MGCVLVSCWEHVSGLESYKVEFLGSNEGSLWDRVGGLEAWSVRCGCIFGVVLRTCWVLGGWRFLGLVVQPTPRLNHLTRTSS